MKNKIDFYLNTDKFYTDNFIPSLKNKLNDESFLECDENYLVYMYDSLEVMIDKSGSVFISTLFDDNNIENINSKIELVREEYAKLSSLSDRFQKYSEIKIIVSKHISNTLTTMLKNQNFKYKLVNIRNKDSITLIN